MGDCEQIISAWSRSSNEGGCPLCWNSPNFYRYGDKYSDKEVIVPAVRLPWQSNDDHPKVWTPWAAIEAGADYIVVGRTLADPWWQENIRFGEHQQPDSASTRVETALIGPRDSHVEAD